MTLSERIAAKLPPISGDPDALCNRDASGLCHVHATYCALVTADMIAAYRATYGRGWVASARAGTLPARVARPQD